VWVWDILKDMNFSTYTDKSFNEKYLLSVLKQSIKPIKALDNLTRFACLHIAIKHKRTCSICYPANNSCVFKGKGKCRIVAIHLREKSIKWRNSERAI
jgi:hypothetical protein